MSCLFLAATDVTASLAGHLHGVGAVILNTITAQQHRPIKGDDITSIKITPMNQTKKKGTKKRKLVLDYTKMATYVRTIKGGIWNRLADFPIPPATAVGPPYTG